MQTPIRLGLIGCGGIVQQQHLPTLLALDTVRLAALADPADDNLANVGATTGVPPTQCYADYRDMLEQAALDAVLIATPHHLHAEQVIAAAEAGCAVISEKPMATSLEDASAVLDAVARHDVIYTVVHNAVFTPGTLHAIALLHEGELPRPQVGRAKSLFPMTEAYHRASPARVWRASKSAGGGCIGDTGYHEIYSLETLMCSPVRYVEARVQTHFFDIDVDDVALLLLEHENGAISTVSTSWGMVGAGAGELGGLCEVHTRGDCLRVVGRGRALHRFSRATSTWSEIPLDVTERNGTGHADYLTATFAALAAGDPPPITGAGAYHNLSIIEAARRATQARRAIDLTEL